LVEDRTLLSTFLVNTAADSGPGSLRQAILDSNAATGASNTIDFAIPGQGVQTIAPLSPLPAITQAVLIDGFSQPANSGTPLIELSGSQTGAGDGLTITGPGVTVRGLDINNFSHGAGIHITGTSATGAWICGNFLGTDPTGTQAQPNYAGVEIDGGATGNLIGTNGVGVNDAAERNLASGNLFAGVLISGQGTSGNAVAGNWIGTDITGTVAVNNGTQPVTDSLGWVVGGGVAINNGASGNRIGTDGKSVDDAGERNVIAGSNNDAIDIYGAGTDRNIVAGNFLGTDMTGTHPLGVAGDGVFLYAGASSNWIGVNPYGGTEVAAEGNVISGNSVGIQMVASNDNIVAGNDIGTDPSGAISVPNTYDGILIENGSNNNWIGVNPYGGADVAAEGNVISANGYGGVHFFWRSNANTVAGNKVGTDVSGAVALGNTDYGIDVEEGCMDNTIGGLAAGAGNLITRNGGPGVLVGRDGSDGSVGDQITGNRIFGNTGQAIDLGRDGVTYNSVTPRVVGPNKFQNFPVVVATAGGQFRGWLSGSLPDTTFQIDVFASAGYNSNGSGEAQDYLGSLDVTTDGRGQAVFDIPYSPPANFPVVTATATDPQGNTSEVSAQRRGRIQAPTQAVRQVPGQAVIFSSTSGDGIALDDADAGPLNALWDLTLSVTSGTLTLSGTTGLAGSGDGTQSLDYQGSRSALNAALEGLRYTPAPQAPILNTLSLFAQSDGAATVQAEVQILINDGVFVVSTTGDSGPGSLRQAILDSDTIVGGTNTIKFDIPGAGLQTIAPITPLPPITTPVLVDGTTQPGFTGTPLVSLDSQSPGSPGPLVVSASNVTIRDVAIDSVLINVTSSAVLIADVHAEGASAQLALLDPQGQVVVQSDGLSAVGPDAVIDEAIASGDYSLKLENTGSAGAYTWTTMLMAADPPLQTLPVGSWSWGSAIGTADFVTADFTGSGRTDLAVVNSGDNTVSVLLGNGDGTFQPRVTYPVGLGPDGIVAGDFNGDGRTDVAVANGANDTVSVLLGNGDGTFQPQVTYGVSWGPGPIVAGDFTGNGRTDLAVANQGADTVSVLLGNGDGTFQPEVPYPLGHSPDAMVAGDFSGNGRTDLALASYWDGTVSVLLGNGDGTFQPEVAYGVGGGPDGIAAGDFTGNGRTDLAIAKSMDNTVSVLLANVDGTFQPQVTYAVVNYPTGIVAGHFGGDGRIDLATANGGDNTVSVLLGNGDGTFQPQVTYPAGPGPDGIAAGDFTGNGWTDLAVGLDIGYTVSVLLGNGDGTFQRQSGALDAAGASPGAIVAGQFTGDGRTDLAVANPGQYGNYNTVSVLLGDGDGAFEPQVIYQVGSDPTAIVAGDFNGDGRTDLATANGGDNTVSVLLGNGDGTFHPQVTYAVGSSPGAIVAGDFTGNGRIDLAVADNDGIQVLLGNGDGTFQPAYTVAGIDGALVAGDFAGNGRTDLAIANGNSVSVLLSNGDGTFQPQAAYPVGSGPDAIVAGDFNGDSRTDLATANGSDNTVSVLLGNGDGTFQHQVTYAVGGFPDAIAAGHFAGSGRTDLAIANGNDNTVSLLLGNGDGTFQPQLTYSLGSFPLAMVAGDFSGRGQTDLAVADPSRDAVSVLLGNGDGTFTSPTQLAIAPRTTPVVADLNGDGTNDVLVINSAGDILYRRGIPGRPGTFQPPLTVNPGNPSRDIAWVPNSSLGPLIASVDAHDDHVSLYAYRSEEFVQVGSLSTGPLPAQIIAADLDHSGWTDLVVRNAGDGTLSVFFNDGSGTFQTGFGPSGPFLIPVIIPVGIGVSDVEAVDTTGAGIYDLVVTNKLSGQVSVLRNLGARIFAPPLAYRAGTGLSEIDPGSTPEVNSLEATAGVAAGPLARGDPTSIATINPGSHTMDVLAGLGGGLFANPVTLPTDGAAHVVRMADFTGNGIQDLAVLTATGLSIYLGDGKGEFVQPKTYAVPPEADGLTVADLTGNGKLDLLVGDAYGDVLVLLGNGDGTFQPYHQANQTIELAVADLTGKGSKDIIYADQGLDRVVVDYGAGNSTVLGSQSTGLLAPGAVTLADLNGDGIPDLIVADSGSNNVLIYPGLGNGQFGPAVNDGYGFFTGTNPIGITAANLTGKLPDLVVANKGSDDVSILLNQGNFNFTQGPRLKSGGSGPVSTVVGHFTGSPYPDILVTNSGSNNVALIPGVGGGFFNDTNPQTFAVGNNPGPLFVGNFDGNPDLLTVNAGSNDVTLISNFMSADATTTTIASGGTDPATAFAFSASSGFEDLVVGNGGDGALALFEGGPQGLSLSSTEFNPDLPSPSSLAFTGVAGGQVQFFAATEGREAAVLVALSLTGTSGASTSPSAITPVIPESVAQLVPLQESSLALVGTLLVVTIETPVGELSETTAQTGTALSPASASAAAVALGQSVVGKDSRGTDGTGEEILDQPGQPQSSSAGSTRAWERFVLGTDEALEQYDREHSKPSAPPSPRAGTPETNPEGAHSDNQGPARQEVPPAQSSSRREHRRFEQIDAALELLDVRRVGETHQIEINENEIHQKPNGMRIGLVGFTHPTAELWDNPRAVGETHQNEINQNEIHQKSNGMRIGLVGFTHPTERYDISAALALAATVTGNFYLGSVSSRGKARRRWAAGFRM
jgi:parallel beta-helix repeat protein